MLPRLGLILLAIDAIFLSALPEGQIWKDIHNIETLTQVMTARPTTYAIILNSIGLAVFASGSGIKLGLLVANVTTRAHRVRHKRVRRLQLPSAASNTMPAAAETFLIGGCP